MRKKFNCGCEFDVTTDHKDQIIGVEWNPDSVPHSCQKTWDMICSGKTGGVFQLDKFLGIKYSKKVKPKNIEEWADLISIIRPGCLDAKDENGKSMTDLYIDRKFGKEEIIYDHPSLEKTLKDTLGLIIYQESSIQIAKELAGFSGPDADHYIRKGIGKKKADLIQTAKKMFLAGCKKNGILKKDAEKIFTSIEASARYSFNKCLSEDTLVETKTRGLVSLKDVKIGEEILDHKNEWTKVLRKHYNGYRKTVLVKINKSYIYCTEDHKFLTNLGLKPIKEAFEERLDIITKSGPEIISLYTPYKLLETMDLEVDNDDHIFMANDIAVSNSHAVSYALNGYYYSAYIKAHFPKVFYCALLDWTKDVEEICAVVEDAKRFGIEIVKPDIRYKNPRFCIDDGNIVFGLTKIKYISQDVVEKIPESKHSYYELLYKYLSKIGVRPAEALIKSGAIDFYSVPRQQMFFELKIVKELSEPQINFLIENNLKLLDGLKQILEQPRGKGQLCYNIASARKIEKLIKKIDKPPFSLNDNIARLAKWEREYLGREFTCTELDSCEVYETCKTCSEISKKCVGKVSVSAIIKEVREKITQKGNLMCSLVIYDLDGTANNVALFGDDYKKYKQDLQPETKVILKGSFWNNLLCVKEVKVI